MLGASVVSTGGSTVLCLGAQGGVAIEAGRANDRCDADSCGTTSSHAATVGAAQAGGCTDIYLAWQPVVRAERQTLPMDAGMSAVPCVCVLASADHVDRVPDLRRRAAVLHTGWPPQVAALRSTVLLI